MKDYKVCTKAGNDVDVDEVERIDIEGGLMTFYKDMGTPNLTPVLLIPQSEVAFIILKGLNQ